MADKEIASLKQFGNTIAQSQPKPIKEKTTKTKQIKQKENSKEKKEIKQYLKPIEKKITRLSCRLKVFRYQIKLFYNNHKKYQKIKKIQQKQTGKSKGYVRLKETKKQIGNTTILIRRRVVYQNKHPTHEYLDYDPIKGSTFFDIPIDDEFIEKKWRR